MNNFEALNKADRQQALLAILDQLTTDEKRFVKSQLAPITFQVDVFALLPPELRDVVLKYLNISELFTLRRVSKRWNNILSSPAISRSAYAAATGNCTSDTGTVEYTKWIKRRVRAEQGRPIAVAKLPMDPAYRETGQMSYANCMFAWVDLDADQTSISLLHLKTGEKRRFTTDNRETLSFLRISDTLVAATSVRGQCHVWDILTGDHKSFRLTSSGFDHFLTRGSKVMVSYEHCIIHFCFTTGKTRIIAAEGIICSSSLHGSEDMLSIIWLRRKLGQNSDRLSKAQHYLQVRKYAVVENTFISTQSRSKELPFEDYEYYEPDSRCITEAYQYQISSMIVPTNKSETHPIYLSLTADDRIAVHEVPVLPGSDEGMHVTWFDQSLVFTSLESRQLGESSYMNFGVARECLSNSGSSGTVFYKFDPVRLLPQLGLPSRLWAGDGFLLYLDQSGLRILVFDEDWYPSGVLQL